MFSEFEVHLGKNATRLKMPLRHLIRAIAVFLPIFLLEEIIFLKK